MADRIRTAIARRVLTGITLESEPLRVYPQPGGGPDSTLAAHLLGFVNREGQGQYGVEQYYQDILGGSPRITVSERDASGQAVPGPPTSSPKGTPGEDISLTIDAGLQLEVEQELLATWIADQAKSVSAIVMDPYTGEVYAEATYPSYDANKYRAIAADDPRRFIDPIVVGRLRARLGVQDDDGEGRPRGQDGPAGHEDQGHRHAAAGQGPHQGGRRRPPGDGLDAFEDAIAYSRNVVAAKVALGLAPTTAEAAAILHDTWVQLGFGQQTGIDLAGEVRGLVNDPAIEPWQQIDLANGAFGQGVAVTPIQLAASYAAFMNGGTLVRPHVVKTIGDRDVEAAGGPRVLSPAMSKQLIGLMPTSSIPCPSTTTGRSSRATSSAARPARPRSGMRSATLEGRPVQLHVRRIHRSSGRPAGPCRRRPDRGRHADDPQGRSARDEYDVLRALPAHRDQRDQDPGPAPRSADRPEGAGPVTAPHARLDAVTDVDRRSRRRRGDRRLTADDLVALTGGRLVGALRSADPRRGRRLPPGRAGTAVRGAAR